MSRSNTGLDGCGVPFRLNFSFLDLFISIVFNLSNSLVRFRQQNLAVHVV